MNDIDEKIEKFENRNTLEITEYGEDPKWLKEKRLEDPFLTMIERLAKLPDVDTGKLREIMDMQERILDRNAKQAFNASMTQAQNKIELVVAKNENKQTKSKYAKLKDILIEAKPIYTGAGFSLMFYEGETSKENHMRICVDIMHDQGHTEQRWGDFAVQTTGIAGSAMMTQIHGEGSAFSYGRRYLTCAIFNIPTGDDDDGNSAGGASEEFISDEQVSELSKLIKETGMMEGAFLKSLKVETLSELTESGYKKALGILNARKKQAKK